MISRLDHLAISVHDLDHSIAFYGEHFGLELLFRQGATGPLQGIAYLQAHGGILELMHRPESSLGEGFHFCFVTEDIQALYDRLVDEGVPVKTVPRPTAARTPDEGGWFRGVFSGPDGEEIEIRGPGWEGIR